MAFDASHHFGHTPGSNEFGMGMDKELDNELEEKGLATEISNVSAAPNQVFEAPEWIRDLSPEERSTIEAKLLRKIDFRLLPMVVLMYIMNYLVS